MKELDLRKEEDRKMILEEGKYRIPEIETEVESLIDLRGYFEGSFEMIFKGEVKGTINLGLGKEKNVFSYKLTKEEDMIEGSFSYPKGEEAPNYEDKFLKLVYEYILKSFGYSPSYE
jgi:hypothetical protein